MDQDKTSETILLINLSPENFLKIVSNSSVKTATLTITQNTFIKNM